MPREEKCAREVAEQEFERFLDAMDIQLDLEQGDADDQRADKLQREKILRAIMYGDLVINDDGEAVYTPWRPKSKYKEPITFHERDGSTLTAGDNKGKNALGRQTYAMMASMCRVDASVFAGKQLVGTDIKVCEALFALLAA
jgi:hypothetical protein